MLLMLEMTFWDLHKLSVVERQKYTQILSSETGPDQKLLTPKLPCPDLLRIGNRNGLQSQKWERLEDTDQESDFVTGIFLWSFLQVT